jgi:hypothetical protein
VQHLGVDVESNSLARLRFGVEKSDFPKINLKRGGVKTMKIRIFAVAVVILATIQAHAGGSLCSNATSLVPDGRLLDFDNVQPNSTNWYQFTAMGGRSYSVEVRDDLDQDPGSELQVTLNGPNVTTPAGAGCPTPPIYGAGTSTGNYEPVLPASATRVSIVTPSGAPAVYRIQVKNTNQTTSHYLSISVTETTLYGSTYNTTANLGTEWLLQNTTSQTITATITATANQAGSPSYTCIRTLSPAFTYVSLAPVGPGDFSPAIPLNQLGSSVVTHNGPPGAVQVFEYWFNTNTTPITIIPVPIAPLRGK